MIKRLNHNALRILGIIQSSVQPPSRQQLADELEIRLNAVTYHLEKMRDAGLVSWEPLLAKTLRLTCRFIPADRLGEP